MDTVVTAVFAILLVVVMVTLLVVIPGALIGYTGYKAGRWLALEDHGRYVPGVTITVSAWLIVLVIGGLIGNALDLALVMGWLVLFAVWGSAGLWVQQRLHQRTDDSLPSVLRQLSAIDTTSSITETALRRLGEQHTREKQQIQN